MFRNPLRTTPSTHPPEPADHSPRGLTETAPKKPSESIADPLADASHLPPWLTDDEEAKSAYRQLAKMEQNEPKRRLIRDAKALAKARGITQAQLAEEVGVPLRTMEDWLQFRRMPQAPGTTLLRRWVEAQEDDNVTSF